MTLYLVPSKTLFSHLQKSYVYIPSQLGLDNVTNVVKICAAKTGKLNQRPISESGMRKLLGELDIQGGDLGSTYLFFIKNTNMLQA